MQTNCVPFLYFIKISKTLYYKLLKEKHQFSWILLSLEKQDEGSSIHLLLRYDTQKRGCACSFAVGKQLETG